MLGEGYVLATGDMIAKCRAETRRCSSSLMHDGERQNLSVRSGRQNDFIEHPNLE